MQAVPVLASLYPSLISFLSFNFPSSFYRIFFLFLPWLPCYFLFCCHHNSNNQYPCQYHFIFLHVGMVHHIIITLDLRNIYDIQKIIFGYDIQNIVSKWFRLRVLLSGKQLFLYFTMTFKTMIKNRQIGGLTDATDHTLTLLKWGNERIFPHKSLQLIGSHKHIV